MTAHEARYYVARKQTTTEEQRESLLRDRYDCYVVACEELHVESRYVLSFDEWLNT